MRIIASQTRDIMKHWMGASVSTNLKQEALLSQRSHAMLRVCIASIQNVERSLLLLVVSASEYHCIQLNSFLFSSLRRIGPCYRPSQTFDGASLTVQSTLHSRL